jgi:Mu transposase-like protein
MCGSTALPISGPSIASLTNNSRRLEHGRPYRYERVQQRRVANDALVSVGAARYSVPVAYVGQTVSVHEGIGHYEFFHHDQLIARHQKADRHSVVMEPAHYAG